ncbi:DUF2158 domain-containing protein [Sulfitobacter sabulilitoris]|uniref:DUF2158 domain-containing protein n=2 Tax=Sulfitobacter sabulilitoris TaxID=2562655 RepID=A0A5S3PBF9_9RHOB|nr:DUF2158 domain-containing protein [Sulfitobacter sabulilitoris]
MRMPDFSEGDRVQIKSGGPIMTVESVDGDSVHCIWFQGKSPNQSIARDTLSKAVISL